MNHDNSRAAFGLMDGRLDPDGARFLLRRIATDADLKQRQRQTTTSWPGNLLRQTALPLAAADGFATLRVTGATGGQLPRRPWPGAGGWRRLVAGGAHRHSSWLAAALMLAQPGPRRLS